MKEKYCKICNRFLGKRKDEAGLATIEQGKIVYRCLYTCRPQKNDYLTALMNDLFDRRNNG